ncbi:MAG: TraB/GumN family protein [Pseudomonadota bacterium]
MSASRSTMMFVRLLGAAFFLWTGAVAARDDAPAGGPVAAADGAIVANPALWRVEDDDSHIWLFGTFHLLPQEAQWTTPAVDAAFAEATALALEAPTGPEAQGRIGEIVRREGLNPPGVALSSLIDASDVVRMRRIAGEVGLPVEAVETMRPWLAIISLSAQFILAQGFDTAYGVEQVLAAKAARVGKPIQYLETVEEQIGAFSGLSPEAEKRFFSVGLAELDVSKDHLDRLLIAWLQGDADLLETLLNSQMRDAAPEMYRSLIVDRNRNWMAAFRDSLQRNETVFVAVGAGHLVGDDGLPTLLGAEGYRVRRQDR